MKNNCIIGLVSLLFFCSCAENEDFSSTGINADINSSSPISSVFEESGILSGYSDAVSSEFQIIDVIVNGYDGQTLSYEYSGKEYSVTFDYRSFYNDDTINNRPRKTLSEEIINNKLGERIKAKLKIKSDFSFCEYCDVISVNGSFLNNPFKSAHSTQEERDYTLNHIENTKCRLSNCDYTFEVDIKDLPMCMKEIYKDEIKPVFFDGYQFEDGKFLIYELLTYPTYDEFGQLVYGIGNDSYITNNCLGFIGTVQSVKGNEADILLNDGVTTCSIPTYYNDGELRVGTTVTVFIRDKASLYRSGKKKHFDFALVYTDISSLKLNLDSLSGLAYIIPNNLYEIDLELISVEMFNEQSKKSK